MTIKKDEVEIIKDFKKKCLDLSMRYKDVLLIFMKKFVKNKIDVK